MRNCTITKNRAKSGGGVFCIASACKIYNCIVSYNVAQNPSGSGGGIYAGGTIISNCTIIGNSVPDNPNGAMGGGISDGANSKIYNCLIANNNAMYGGGIRPDSSTKIFNCTIVSNYGSYAGGVFNGGAFLNCIVYFNTGTSSNYSAGVFTNCCIAPTNGLAAGSTNNIQSDPQFVNKDTGDWHLTSGSPCINVGTNQAWMTNTVDLDGRMRIRYGTVDMGAYEKIYEGTIYSIGGGM